MRSSTLRSLCAASAKWDLKVRRWDFVAAYLQGMLEEGETVYCSLPPGYEDEMGTDGKPAVYQIIKSVYGMAQSGRRWRRTLFLGIQGWARTVVHHGFSKAASGGARPQNWLGWVCYDTYVI